MKVDFGGVEETVVTREDFPLDRARDVLGKEVIAILGYGPQGRGQSLNLRDNLKGTRARVVVGQREGTETYRQARDEGWEPGTTLLSLDEAAARGTIIAHLLSDAAQKMTWPDLERRVDPGKALYFSHGFGMHFNQHTGINPRGGVDVIMVAPKGAGQSVRGNFLNGSGINASYAVERNPTGVALERTLAMGVGIGAGYLFETTFRNEVVSDHFGERAFLLGEVWALAEAAYFALKVKGELPQQAFIKSSEQITQVLLPLIGRGGAEEVYKQAQQAGQLSTVLRYQEAVRQATTPILNQLYESVQRGDEAKIALDANSDPRYRQKLNAELDVINTSEMWRTGKDIRDRGGDRSYDMRITNWALAGAVLGAMEAQYQTLVDRGHRPSEAFNETVEEATQSLNQFYQARGVSHLLAVCSSTAQRGALDWGPRFRKVLNVCFLDTEGKYSTGSAPTVNYNSTRPNMWEVGAQLRPLRPENLRQ